MRDSFILYTQINEVLKELKDEEKGQLFQAIMDYETTGEIPDDLSPIVKVAFIPIRQDLDANNKKYDDIKQARSEAGKKAAEARAQQTSTNVNKAQQTSTNVNNDQHNVNVNVNDNDYIKEKPTKVGKEKSDPVADSALSDPLKDKLRDWLRYKLERREPYKPMGLKSLITLTKKYEQQYGTVAVIDVINSSMGAGYKGIVWDSLNNPRGSPNRQQGDKLSQKLEEMKKW